MLRPKSTQHWCAQGLHTASCRRRLAWSTTCAFPTWDKVRGQGGERAQSPGQRGVEASNAEHLYLLGWAPGPGGCLTARWCPRCWSARPPPPTDVPNTHTGINYDTHFTDYSSLYICAQNLTSALTILSTMVSSVSILWHFMTPSKYWERCFRAWVTVMSRLL